MLKSKELEKLSIFFAVMSLIVLFVGIMVNEGFLFIFTLLGILAVWLDDLGIKRWDKKFVKRRPSPVSLP